jgi:lysozyme
VAAYTSFTYNVGVGAFEKSTLLRKLNGGDRVAACNELPRWVYARGVKLPGLVNRRREEQALCLSGLADANTARR